MSRLARAEMAESKLKAINNLIVTTSDDVDVTDQILHIIGAQVWDGYQVLDSDVSYLAAGGLLNDKKHSPKCGDRPHGHGWECDPTCPGCDAGRSTPLRDHKEP